MIYVINFQKSTYNSVDYFQLFVNCGIYVEVFELREMALPKEYECTLSIRNEQITGRKQQYFEIIESRQKAQLAEEIMDELIQILAFYNSMNTVEKVVKKCITKYGTRDYQKMTAYLAKTKDVKNLELFYKNHQKNLAEHPYRDEILGNIVNIAKEHGIEL